MTSNEKKEEYFDIYDENRNLTGRKLRRGDAMNPGDYHLVVQVCIFNSKNEMLIQHRQPFKRGWPNMWDITAGGAAQAGETSRTAAEREVAEELGLKIDLTGVRPYFTVNFKHAFVDYYVIRQEVDIEKLSLQEEEVQKVRWADKEEVLTMQEDGTMIPYSFITNLFELWNWYDTSGNRKSDLTIKLADEKNLASWMSLIDIVKWNFPGLETDEKVLEYKNTVVEFMRRKNAICVLDRKQVVGILLFSTKYNMLCCMAVHPEYRRKGIATRMVNKMLEHMDRSKDIVVETFREDDPKGTAPRAFYKRMGFTEGELCYFEDQYPEQKFVLKGTEGQ